MYIRSIVDTAMKMYADVYEQENTQNADTGSIERHWEYKRTIRCMIQPSKSSGTSTSADGKEFGNGAMGYREPLQLRGRFPVRLSKRWRIANIRSSDNKSIFIESERNSEPPTIFEVISCHPMTDPFGRFSHYDVTLERASVQANDEYKS